MVKHFPFDQSTGVARREGTNEVIECDDASIVDIWRIPIGDDTFRLSDQLLNGCRGWRVKLAFQRDLDQNLNVELEIKYSVN